MASKKKKTNKSTRVRSDIRVSPDLGAAIDEITTHLGLTKQSLIVAATTKFCAEVLPLTKSKKKASILATLEKEFQKEIDAAKSAA